MKHAQPYGLTVYALAAVTLAALGLLSFALNRLRRPRKPRTGRQPAAMRPVQSWDAGPDDSPAWTAGTFHREDPQ